MENGSVLAVVMVALVAATVGLVVGARVRAHTDRGPRGIDEADDPVSRQVVGLTEQVGALQSLVQELRVDRADQHGELRNALAVASEGQQRLSITTESLREALSNSRSRGRWGERAADDILRHAGFIEGVGYRRQTALAGGGIPDFTFLLPEGRLLHMDAKFPADNYVRALEASSAIERERCEKAFLSDVRARVRELADRGYTAGEDAYDTVLLFIPVEAIFGAMHELDPDLLDEALGLGIVLCSPASLFAVLAVVRRTVEDVAVERTSRDILDCLASFSRQWELFVDQMDKVAKQLGTVQGSFDQLTGARRNQLDRQLARVDELRSSHTLDAAGTSIGV